MRLQCWVGQAPRPAAALPGLYKEGFGRVLRFARLGFRLCNNMLFLLLPELHNGV